MKFEHKTGQVTSIICNLHSTDKEYNPKGSIKEKKQLYFMGCNIVKSVENQQPFRSNTSPPSLWFKNR
jgi:hypothetical protein